MAERAPGTAGDGRATWSARFLRPAYVFPALLAAIVATVLLTPVAAGRRGDPRLTTRSTESQGAQGFFELATRLGWRTSRRELPFTTRSASGTRGAVLDTGAVYAVLDPPTDLTAAEAGALLSAVRRGAGLLVVLGRRSTLADSLGLRPSNGGAAQLPPAGADSPDSCPPGSSRKGAIDWPGGRVYSYWLEARAPLPSPLVTLARVEPAPPLTRRTQAQRREEARRREIRRDSLRRDSTRHRPGGELQEGEEDDEEDDEDDVAYEAIEDGGVTAVAAPDTGAAGDDSLAPSDVSLAAAVGFPLGAGRVVAVADPDWLRNDVLRVCAWNAGVQAARMLEYLARGRPAGASLVFDEFHQGYGRHPNALRATWRALTRDARGRSLAQALVAALVLLAALAPRAVAPRSTARLARRSPLEHVGALSRAYAQIGATRLATRRLVRGIRRRHGGWGTAAGTPRGASRGGESDDDFLAAVAERFPDRAADVGLLREAAATPRSPAQMLDVGRAAERVERALARRGAAPAPSR